jgi:hypothetical protein
MSMTRLTTWKKPLSVLATLLFVGVCADSAQAAGTVNRVVGTCTPAPAVTIKARYTTIQDAVDGSILGEVPSNILVCPGIYREQVEIAPVTASLLRKVAAGTVPAGDIPDHEPIITLKGINLTVGPAVIAAPVAGLAAVFTSTTLGPLAPQLLVRETSGVNVSNLELDGSGGGCPLVGSVPARAVGIVFAKGPVLESLGEDMDGSIKFVSIHDEQYPWTAACGADSFGILSENTIIKINDNQITRINDMAVYLLGGNNQALRNHISFCGGYGFFVDGSSGSDVSLNTLSQIFKGINLTNGANLVTVELNTLTPSMTYGVVVDGGANNSITRNKGSFTGMGILLDNGSSGNLVEDNQLDHCGDACIGSRFSHGNNIIDWNDFDNSAAYGIWIRHTDNQYLTDEVYSNFFGGSIPVQICDSTTNGLIFDPLIPMAFCQPIG